MTTTRRSAPMTRRGARLVAGLVLGALPGVLLVLVAQYLVSGEPQLTVGVAGLWLAAVGAMAGLVVAAWPRAKRSRSRTRPSPTSDSPGSSRPASN